MSFFLSGFPIPDTQDIGDSLPYLNKSLDTIDTMLALLSTGGPNFATLTSYVIQTDGSSSYFLTNYINGLPDSYIVYLDGVKQLPYTDYTISNATSSIVFSSPIPPGGLTLEVIRALALVSFAEDGTKLPLVGGTLTGPLQGPTATFTTSLSSPAIRGNLLLGTNFISGDNILIQRGTAQLTALNLTDFGSLRLRYGTLTLDGSTINNPFGSITTQNGVFTGNVGIGTSTPGDKLEVNGNIHSKNTSQYSGIAVKNATNTVGYIIGTSASNDNGAMGLLREGVETVVIKASGDSIFTGGNVGIGTATPTDKLHVTSINGTFATGTRPSGWGGGITTWDLYAGGSVGAGSATGSLSAYINKDGNIWAGNAVGIGSSTLNYDLQVSKSKPGQYLEVKAENLSTANNTAARYSLATSIPNHYALWEVHANVSAPAVNFASGDGATTGMIFTAGATLTSQPIVFRQGAAERLRIGADGSTTIKGVTILEGGTAAQPGSVDAPNLSGTYIQFNPIGDSGASDWAYLRQIGSGYDDFHLALDFHDNGNFASGGQSFSIRNVGSASNPDLAPETRFIINGLGNVGIGTNNPGVRLSIAGNTNRILELASVLNTAPSNYDGGEIISIINNTAVNGMTFSNVDPRLLTIGNTSSGGYIRSSSTTIESTNNTIFTSQAVERMRITSAGNVGIGTSAPARKLDVTGDVGVHNIYSGNIYTGVNTSTGDAAIELGSQRTGNGNAYIDFHSASGADYGARIGKEPTINGNFTMYNAGAGDLVFGTVNTERMRISNSGNVGIGTSAPVAKLDVTGGIRVNNANSFQWYGSAAATDQKIWDAFSTNASDGNTLYFRAVNDAYTSANAWLGVTRTANSINNIYFATGAQVERLRITAAGNVGIGTTTPESKLHVAGDIRVNTGSRLFLSDGDDSTRILRDAGNNGIALQTASTTRLFVADTGNVGIGTTTPAHALTVVGDISARNYLGINPAVAHVIQLGADINDELASDASGYSVSMNAAGDRVAIGALHNDGNGTGSGHVRIYSWNGSAWTQLGSDINGEASFDQSGYSVSMNAAGDRVAIGANLNDGNGASSGHVRIYSWNGSAWTQLGSDINGEVSSDQSGYSVSMNAAGDRVAIGAPFNDGNATSSGHVRIYSWNGSAWTQLGSDINGEASFDQSGYSVSMNAAGDRVAIGAPFNNGTDSGHVRIYSWNGSAWTQLGSDIDGEAGGDQSGYSVSMNAAGDRVAIGAPFNDGNGNQSGHVRIYSWNGSAWTQLGSDIDGVTFFERWGHSVSMNAAGDRLVVGSRISDNNGVNFGIYQLINSVWVRVAQDVDRGLAVNRSGWSVSMNAAGDRVAIGSYYVDTNTGVYAAGKTRMYSWSNSRGTVQLDGTSLLIDPVTQIASVGAINASSIFSGYLQDERIPSLDASKIVSGTFSYDVKISTTDNTGENNWAYLRLGDLSTDASSAAFSIQKEADSCLYINEITGIFTNVSTNRLKITPGGSSGSFNFTGNISAEGNLHARTFTEVLVQPTTAASMSLDLSTGSLFRISLTTSITSLTFTNTPASPRVCSFVIQLVADGTARTVAWPVSVKWPSNIAPTITSTSGKLDTFSFLTYDGGTTWLGFTSAQNH